MRRAMENCKRLTVDFFNEPTVIYLFNAPKPLFNWSHSSPQLVVPRAVPKCPYQLQSFRHKNEKNQESRMHEEETVEVR
jgi:hypothetical protein